MKILHVISGYFPDEAGGMQVHLRDLCRAQQTRGDEPRILARCGGEGDDYQIETATWQGVEVQRLRHNFSECTTFASLFANHQIDRQLARSLQQDPVDIVHFHHFSGLSISMILVAREAGAGVVVTLHDHWLACPLGQRIRPEDLSLCEPLDRRRCLACLRPRMPHLLPGEPPAGLVRLWRRDPGIRQLEDWDRSTRQHLALADRILVPSPVMAEMFRRWGLPKRSFRTVTHGLPRQDLAGEPRGRSPVHCIGFIGNVMPSKGVHVLIDAFERLARPGLRLEIHGGAYPYHGDEGYLSRLEAQARQATERGAEKGAGKRAGKSAGKCRVTFHGAYEVADLPSILQRFDVLVVPALWHEAFCLTAREGALAGLPVVAANIGGLEEAVAQGLALGFAAGDAADLAQTLNRLLADDELRDEMSRKAHLVVDIADCAARTSEVYAEARRAAGARGGRAEQA